MQKMATTYSTGDYYTTSTAGTGTYYTTAAPSQQWYYYNSDGEIIQSDNAPQHTHEMPGHTHGNWGGGTWQQQGKIIFSDGEDEVMRLNKGVEMKVGGKWVKVEDYLERLDQLDAIMERMYQILSPWQREQLKFQQQEKEDGDFEHFDPDLFKV